MAGGRGHSRVLGSPFFVREGLSTDLEDDQLTIYDGFYFYAIYVEIEI